MSGHPNNGNLNAAKLTPEQADMIAESDAPKKQLARRYGVSLATIYRIKKGYTYRRRPKMETS